VAASRRFLQRTYGIPSYNFCYPSSIYDSSTIAAVKAAPYVGAVTEEPGYAGRDRPYELNRYEIEGGQGVETLASDLQSGAGGAERRELPGAAPALRCSAILTSFSDSVKRRIRRGRRRARRFWRERKRLAIALIVGGLMATAAIGFVAYQLLKRPADIHNPNVAFKPQRPKKPKARTVNWPMFGLDRARTRYLAARGVKPPYRLIWHYTDKPLIEFPPVYALGKLYFVNNNGYAYALAAETGKVLWERRIGLLNASSPTYQRNRLYIVNLEPGHVIKLDAKTGKVLWKHSLPGRAESSPLVIGRTLYFGCEDGELFALSTRNGHVRWATTLGGAVKSAPAFLHGVLYVGDYGGYMNAVDAKTGKLFWLYRYTPSPDSRVCCGANNRGVAILGDTL